MTGSERRDDAGAPAMRALFQHVVPTWTPERAELVRVEVRRSLARRTRARRVVAAMVSLPLLLVGALTALRPWMPSAGQRAEPEPRAPEAMVLDDGARIEPRDERSQLTVAATDAGGRVVRLGPGGGARFALPAQLAGVFRVEAGIVAVEALGTRFSVDEAAGRVHVAVTEGRVTVLWPSGRTELDAGASGFFPPEAKAETKTADDEAAPLEPSAPRERAPRTTGRRWRALAQAGRFDDAYRALASEGGPAAVPDEPGALLLAADVARLSRHPREALPPLHKLLARYARDPRAGLAAFTLGLVELQELGRPREAAQAFARARALDPAGDLAEDALAREVESHFRAGETARAETAAKAYLSRYPSGRWARAVRRYGALD